MKKEAIYFFVLPLLLLAAICGFAQMRLAQPEEALRTARSYLETEFPRTRFELGKSLKVGEAFSKKWRLEFNGVQEDGRVIQANLLVDRWQPGRLVGRFLVRFNPTQILDGGWENPSLLDRVSAQIPQAALLLAAALILILQTFYMFRILRRGGRLRLDGPVLVLLGGSLLAVQLVVEVHLGFMMAYAFLSAWLGYVVLTGEGKRDG